MQIKNGTGQPQDKRVNRILLVEDDPIAQQANSSALKYFGYKVDLSATGEKAISMAMRHQYLLVLMDIGLPDISGINATSIIRNHKKTLPIIALTSHADSKTTRQCLIAGMCAVANKPISATDLNNLVKQHCK
jgi:CheY-like chemotaxis protein